MGKILVAIMVVMGLTACSHQQPSKTPALRQAVAASDAEATCTGTKGCNACKNCKYCKHCAKEGGTCGVCK